MLSEYEAEREVLRLALAWAGHGMDDMVNESGLRLWLAVQVLDAAREPQWHPRTWADVRAGDTVRLPAAEHQAPVPAVHVESIAYHQWHVSDERGPWSDETHSFDVIRSERTEPAVRLREYPGQVFKGAGFAAGRPVEILLSPAEFESVKCFGWAARLHVTTTTTGTTESPPTAS